jgi:uncharacterized protein YjbI with pentapeptide repeats
LLTDAQLQRANLGGAQLQGAYLWSAQLEGANLAHAQIQGANLSGAKLQGASLVETELQGALLNGAHLQDAVLDKVFVFRTSVADIDLESAAVHRPISEGRVGRRESGSDYQPMEEEAELTDKIIEEWIGAAIQYAIIPWGDEDRRAENRASSWAVEERGCEG